MQREAEYCLHEATAAFKEASAALEEALAVYNEEAAPIRAELSHNEREFQGLVSAMGWCNGCSNNKCEKHGNKALSTAQKQHRDLRRIRRPYEYDRRFVRGARL